MQHLTQRQAEVLDFIGGCVRRTGVPPTSREIQEHFGFASQTAAMDHLRALERKGAVRRYPGKARAVTLAGNRATHSSAEQPAEVQTIPLYGQIAAGMPADSIEEQDPEQRIAVDPELLGLPKSSSGIFALRVSGNSMTGAHILDGDVVVVEARAPRHGEVVAALIDGETTLKRYLVRNGKPYLKAENPDYPELVPAAELSIQGVMLGLMRRTPRSAASR